MAPSGGQTTVGLTVATNMDVSGILNGVKSMQGAFNGLKLPANLTGDAIKQFDKLKESLTKYRELMEKGPSTKADLKQLEKLERTIKSSFSDLSKVYDELSGKKIYLEADATAIKNAQKDIDQLKQDVQNKLGSIKFEFSSPTKGKVDIGLNELVSDMERAVKSSKTVSASMREMTNSVKSGNFTDAAKGLTQIEQQAAKLKGASVGLLKTFQQMGLIQFNKSAEDLYKSGEHVALLHQGFEKLRGVLSADDAELKRVTKSLGDAIDKKSELEKIGEHNYNSNLAKQAQDANQLKQGYDQCAEAARGFAQQSMSAAQQVEQLQQSTQYFFSLRNMINLLKRGIDEAVQSVKELDKAMTETAVVTDYKVSDLWGMLPEYTKVANQLGATTQGAYETMTLYYQQGLEQQQAFELGAETMKMARIAGLDYAETTDMMTAALRGFNMELNETSAKRVNDVYSELAAITASDTEELGTAMQRTASIAASAGASFEGTTAFLAQAIETTREPAENIGTAMKTIVARFQELKKNPLEISEVDGEEVDYNKIDTALKTIGVDLKDANGQFRDFDEVMLDISARWDSLSQAQQRYIATTAAGSRQQSRFIAMVSNYDRTMQLMEAANNSAGASDEQFGKTMDSLESKLNKLHNAWQLFTMGIANNGMIKLAVDGLTGFLNITNKIIDTLSLGSGVFKSFLSIFAAFTGLKATGRLANQLIGGLGGLVDPTSTFKQGFKGGAIRQGQTGAAQAKAISDPIVTAVNRIYGAITGKQATTNQTVQNTSADFKSFKDANAEMRNFLGGIKANEKFSIADAYGKIGKLDNQQQKAVLQQLPGLQLSLQKNGINFDTTNLSDNATKLVNTFTKEINQGLKDKSIDSQGVLQLFGTPDNFKKGMQVRGPEYVKAAEEVLNKGIDRAKIQDEALNEKIIERDLLGAKWSDDQVLEMAQKEADKRIKALQENNLREGIKGKASPGMQAANDFAAMGQAAIVAGQGVAQLGMQLSNAGFEQAGAAVTSLGYQISSLGSIAASTGTLVGKILDNGGLFGKTGLIAAHPVIAALVVAVAALGTVFAAASAKIKKIKEAGEEVTKTFTETNKTVQDNIAKLKSYQSEFAVLSKGVDSNGNNVSLDDSQYQRYLEIVDDIAAINPEIVEGYNAQGHAIINNNKALAETLQTQEEIRKEALATYTDPKQLDSLIKARNVNKGYYEAVADKTKARGTFVGGVAGQVTTGYTSPMTGDVATIADKLGLIKDFDEATLQKYGIDSLEALKSGEAQAVKNFVKHRQKIEAELNNSELKLDEGLLKGFDKLGEDAVAFDEAIKPVYDNLLTSVSNSPIFDSIAPEFREALNMGLKDLASQDLSASDMSRAATTMATKFANLTTGSGKYQEAMDKVADAQEKFATNLEETEYRANVQPAIDDLVRLKEEALKEGGAYGQALAEYLDNQIERIANFTEEGTTTIQEGLNTATDAIAQAESALDNFNEATKKDFSTAAEGMRGIYDKIFETYKDSYGNELEKHTEGEGDNTFWTGAEALLSENKLAGGVDEVTKSLKKLEPWLREGKEGMDAFFMDVISNDKLKQLQEDGLISLDERGWFAEIPEDQWSAVADALGISEDLLTSMLNKARQFGLIEFDNLEKVREALATSDSAITGVESNAQGQKALYVKEDTMRQNLREAGYNTKESQDKVIERLLKEQNVNMVKTMENINKDEAKALTEAWGIKDLPDLITKMSETGDYNREEILDIAEKAGLGSGEAAADVYDKVISALDNPELAAQTSELQSINAKLDAIVEKETGKGVEDHEAAQKEAHEASLGENGIATNFAKGLDAEGKVLDTGSFAVVRDELEKTKAQYEENAAYYTERAKYANEQDKAHFETLAELYTKDAKAIADAITEGEKTVEKKKKDAEKRKTSDKFKRDDKEGKNNGKEPAPSPAVSSNRPLEQTEKRNIETTEKHHKTEETDKITKYDSSETAEHKKLQKLWEEDKKNPHLDKDVTVEGNDKGLKDLNKDVNKFDARFNNPFMAYVKANMDEANKGVIDFNAYVQKQNPQVLVSANTKSAKSSISSLYNVSTLFVPIKPDFQGTWEKSITIRGKREDVSKGQDGGHPVQAKGKNNHASIAGPPSFGSAARGYGRLGPKGKGGPTLTGELGYEIAWLPSENRSMILGANGPQMIDLPGNAVVWNHEQSKKILKQKSIPIGSQANPYTKGSSKDYVVTYITDSGGGKGGGKKDNPKGGKGKDKTSNKVKATSKKVYQWWEKISRQVKAVERKANKLGDKLTKTFNDIRASIDDISEANKDFIKAQKKSIELNQSIVNTYTKKLTNLNKNGKASRTTIKYKKGKKEKTAHVNIGKFIKYDSDTGQYYVDKKAINAKTKDSKAKRRAIRDKAYELIDKYQDRRDEAQDAVDKAKEELADYRKEINDTFFGWENELTQVLRITSEIEKTEARINQKQAERDRTEFYMDNLDFSRGINGATGFNDLWTNYSSQITQNIKLNEEEIKLKNEQIKANKEEMQAAADLTDSLVTYADINGDIKQESEKDMYDRIKTITEESGTGTGWDELSTQEKQIFARKEFFRRGLVTGNAEEGYALNEDALNTYLKDIKNGKIQNELGDLFKSIFDTLNEKTLENIQLGTEAYELETDNLKLEQERLDKAKDISEQLYGWKNTLTKILELTNKIEQSEKRTSLLKSGQDYYAAKQKAGYGVSSTDILGTYVGQMVSTINQIQDRSELLRKQQEDLQKYIAGQDIETELANLRSKPQTEIEKARIETLEEEAKIRQKAQRYITTKTNADGTISIEFNTELFEQEKGREYDATTGQKIADFAQELVTKNNEIADTMAANLSDITELYTALVDLRQEYADRAKELREAYGAQQQKVIDNLKNLYSAIDNNFKELINQVKQSIQQRRQVEDNAKTEQDISKKQQRLASLRANTAGGNRVAIAQLEKEITDAQQSYGRTLEDQLLDKVSQQGDLAAKQREQQIQLMQAQRDWAAKTGKDAEEINQWLQNPEKYKSNITAVLQSEAGWTAMATAEQTVFNSSLDAKLADLKTLPEKINTTSATLATIKPAIEATEKNIKDTTKTAIDNITTETLKVFNTNMKSLDGKIEVANSGIEAVAKKLDNELAKKIEAAEKKKTEEAKKAKEPKKAEETKKTKEPKKAEKTKKAKTPINQWAGYKGFEASGYTEDDLKLIGMTKDAFINRSPGAIDHAIGSRVQQARIVEKDYTAFLTARGSKTNSGDKYWGQIGKVGLQQQFERGATLNKSELDVMSDLVKTDAITWKEVINAYVKLLGKKTAAENLKSYFGNNPNNSRKRGWKQYFGKDYPKYKTGGIANFTGPAWLDGTPSKPELVLNAQDTQNFLALRDILSKAIGSTNSITNSYGGNATYEININVDKIEKDYDVDRVVEKVKKEIVKGSGYRNVTQVRNFK